MANTVIQLKYSNVTSVPPTLNVAEPAYSNVSNKLFIDDGTGVVAIGGKFYTGIIDSNTSDWLSNTLVMRDAQASAKFNVVTANTFVGYIENSNTTNFLSTAKNFSVSGGDITASAVAFNGNNDITLVASLDSVAGLSAGEYGNTTAIPVVTVGANGRVLAISTQSISTALGIAGDTGTDSISLASDTLTFVGGDGITSAVDAAGSNVTFSVDNTVIRNSGSQTITGDIAITGNLIVSGNTITQDVETIVTEDSLIKLAANNVSDALDIGFYGEYNDGSAKFAGLIRDASDGVFKLFVGETTDPVTNTVSYGAGNRATLDTNITGGTVSSLSSAIAVGDGGTGVNTFTSGAIVIGNGTGALLELANTGTAGQYANASHVPVITTDAYGRVSNITVDKISINADQLTAGLVAINRGGTNNDTYTTGGITYYDGSKIASLANTTYAHTGTLSAANTITGVTVDSYGRLTATTSAAISIDAGQVTSGILPVVRGGTGADTFAIKGVIVSDASSTTGALGSLTSATEGHVLQISSSGAPTFAHLNGGTF